MADPDAVQHDVHQRAPVQCFLVLVLVNLMWAFQFSGAKIATARLGPARRVSVEGRSLPA